MTATIVKKLDFDYWRSERQGDPDAPAAEIRARLVAQRERERVDRLRARAEPTPISRR